MRKNQKPEEKIRHKFIERIKNWKEIGYVVDFDDVSNLGRKFNPYTCTWIMNSEAGKRDIIVLIKESLSSPTMLWVVLFENKSELGRQDIDQIKYQSRFIGIKNVFYKVTSDPKDVDKIFEKITGHYQKKLDELPKDL